MTPPTLRFAAAAMVAACLHGRVVESLQAFAAELDRVGVDRVAELTVIRDGKERRVKVRVVDVR